MNSALFALVAGMARAEHAGRPGPGSTRIVSAVAPSSFGHRSHPSQPNVLGAQRPTPIPPSKRQKPFCLRTSRRVTRLPPYPSRYGGKVLGREPRSARAQILAPLLPATRPWMPSPCGRTAGSSVEPTGTLREIVTNSARSKALCGLSTSGISIGLHSWPVRPRVGASHLLGGGPASGREVLRAHTFKGRSGSPWLGTTTASRKGRWNAFGPSCGSSSCQSLYGAAEEADASAWRITQSGERLGGYISGLVAL